MQVAISLLILDKTCPIFIYPKYVGIVKKIYLMLLAYGRSNPQEEFAQIGRQPHAIFKWV
jgi:hypothetical protein